MSAVEDELRNEVARLKQQLEDAHNEVDLLETIPVEEAGVPFPCPPRTTSSGVVLTVAGRLSAYRERHRCQSH